MATIIARNINVDVDPNAEFEPGMFSIPELRFMLDHLNEPPIVAFEDFDPDDKKNLGVMQARVEPFLERMHELDTVRAHKGIEWAGYEAIADAIERFLLWHARTQEIARRSRGVFVNPSQWEWDDTGRAHKYAINADSGEMVRTEIADDGSRRSFKVRLILSPEDVLASSVTDLMPWVTKAKRTLANNPDKMIETAKGKTGHFECSVCGHREEFRPASRMERTQALGRMAKHLKQAKSEIDRHRLLYTKAFKSGTKA